MASESVDTPQGTTVTDVDGNWEGEVTSISFGGFSREDIDTTHLGTIDYKTFQPADLSDPGTMTLTVHFNPDDDLPNEEAKGQWKIDWPAGTDWTFQAYCNDFSPDPGSTDDKMTADLQLKISGTPTITQSS